MHAAALGRDLFGGHTARDVRAKTGGRATSDLAMQEQGPVRTALVGAMLVADNLQQLIDDAKLCLVAHCPDISTASSALSQIKAELLITEMPNWTAMPRPWCRNWCMPVPPSARLFTTAMRRLQ